MNEKTRSIGWRLTGAVAGALFAPFVLFSKYLVFRIGNEASFWFALIISSLGGCGLHRAAAYSVRSKNGLSRRVCSVERSHIVFLRPVLRRIRIRRLVIIRRAVRLLLPTLRAPFQIKFLSCSYKMIIVN